MTVEQFVLARLMRRARAVVRAEYRIKYEDLVGHGHEFRMKDLKRMIKIRQRMIERRQHAARIAFEFYVAEDRKCLSTARLDILTIEENALTASLLLTMGMGYGQEEPLL